MFVADLTGIAAGKRYFQKLAITARLGFLMMPAGLADAE
jgi:hypothetical protein